MRKTFTMTAAAALGVAALAASPALAAGAHSGGHDDGDGHGGHDNGGHHATAIGEPADPAEADRTVTVTMTEMAFDPGEIEVKPGEAIRFVIRNEGELVHEFNIGTAAMHMAHADEMMKMMDSGMVEADRINHDMMESSDMGHDDPNSLLLEPGDSGEITWRFTRDASLEISCNVPGHREGGMVGRIHMDH